MAKQNPVKAVSNKGKGKGKAVKAVQAKGKGKAVQAKGKVPARTEATKAGEKGKKKHSMIFQGAELASDLKAASQYGDNYYLQPKQLAANQVAAINRALANLPCHKGQVWTLDNVEITAKLK
jgi:hypothetical protein